jgi:hypothetical protein
MTELNFNKLFKKAVDEVRGLKIAHKEYLIQGMEKSKSRIFRNYEDINYYAKVEYMKKPRNNKPQLLDRHKFVASFIIAFLNELNLENYKDESNLTKEKISLIIGLSVFRFFIISDASSHNDATFTARLKSDGWIFPPLICDNNKYVKNWVSELFFAYEEERLFVLSLAHELFLLETYNREIA